MKNNFDPMQALINGMAAQWMQERAGTQMTLGKLIEALEGMSPDRLIDGIEAPHSYRGYYSDLAFEKCANQIKAGDLLAICRGAMGQVFEGYKGGDYVMGALTPVWIADYGCCGVKLLGIGDGGELLTKEDDF